MGPPVHSRRNVLVPVNVMINSTPMSTLWRSFQRVGRSWRCASEIRRLRQLPGPAGRSLAAVFEQWRRREPIDEPVIELIEQQRNAWLDATAPPVNVEPVFDDMSVFVRACHASKAPVWAELLFRIVRDTRPRVALELGTNLGISSAYLAAAASTHGGDVVTLEGAPPRVALARWFHQELGIENVRYVTGKFAKTLPQVLDDTDVIDFAFIDGHHHLEPTLAYLDLIYPRLSDNAVVVFDDIGWSSGMMEAWHRIQADTRFRFLVDIGNVGIGVVRADDNTAPPPMFYIVRPSIGN